MPERKIYLGDGAYAEFDGYSMIITAENGLTATDTVFLEPEVFLRLLKFAARFYDSKTLIEAVNGLR